MYMVFVIEHEWNSVAEVSLVSSADPSAMNYINYKYLSKDHNS